MRLGGQRHAPTSLSPREISLLVYRRLFGLHSRSRWVRKISPLPGFDARNVQPVACRYIDYSILARSYIMRTKVS